ncbi:MAG: radical SAM family heme chaperone HemW [Thermomicrobiales bacterium]
MIVAPALLDSPIGLYIHIPFCAHICPYCDFTTYAGKESLIPRYVEAVRREVSRVAGSHDGRSVATIFIGGGTPSLLSIEQMTALLDACRAEFDVDSDAEISIEANPNGLTSDLLAGYRTAGVNRLSIGAQTFDRRGLRTLGRQHESDDVLTAMHVAREVGYQNLSLDFIFGWPGQTLARWEDDLDRLIALGREGLDHLSLYSLIVEPGTPFADAAARGILQMPDDDATADMYELAMAKLGAAGWSHYEVANWARTPDGPSRHNTLYWRYGDYYGIGAGAHGNMRGLRTMNHLLPETYCAALESGASGLSNVEEISPAIARAETMMVGLRLLQDGVNADAFGRRHGIGLFEVYGPVIDGLVRSGLLLHDVNGVRLTPRGLMLANDVAERFL